MTQTFDQLIHPMSFASFVQDYKSRQFVHVPGEPHRWADLVSHDDLNDVLSRVAVMPGTVHLLRPNVEVPPDEYLWTPVKDGARRAFRAAALETELARGTTLHLRQCETLF